MTEWETFKINNMEKIVNWFVVLVAITMGIYTVINFKGDDEWIGVVILIACAAGLYVCGWRGLVKNKN